MATAAAAEQFTKQVSGTILAKTGRHTYTEWDQILDRQGAHHLLLDPFRMPANRRCRRTYSKVMCPQSLDILSRTVALWLKPDMDQAQQDQMIAAIRAAAAMPT